MHFNTILPCNPHIQGVHKENQPQHEGDHLPQIAAWNRDSARPYACMSCTCIILPLLSIYTYVSPVVLTFQVAWLKCCVCFSQIPYMPHTLTNRPYPPVMTRNYSPQHFCYEMQNITTNWFLSPLTLFLSQKRTDIQNSHSFSSQ